MKKPFLFSNKQENIGIMQMTKYGNVFNPTPIGML
jgi:hypothetical protein